MERKVISSVSGVRVSDFEGILVASLFVDFIPNRCLTQVSSKFPLVILYVSIMSARNLLY